MPEWIARVRLWLVGADLAAADAAARPSNSSVDAAPEPPPEAASDPEPHPAPPAEAAADAAADPPPAPEPPYDPFAVALFDPDWYRAAAGPLSEGTDLFAHFRAEGWRAGLSPHPLFDTAWYLDTNPDVRAAGADPLHHFLAHGRCEGRAPHPLVDLHGLARQLPGAADPFGAYRAGAWRRGITPHPLVDPLYLADTLGTDREPLEAYLRRPDRARIQPHPLFDPDRVAAALAALGEDPADPLLAYLSGRHRGRISPHACFDPEFYLAEYPDVPAAGVDPLAHYLAGGHREGRVPFRHFPFGFGAEERSTAAPLIRLLRTGIDPQTLVDDVPVLDHHVREIANLLAGRGAEAAVLPLSPNGVLDPTSAETVRAPSWEAALARLGTLPPEPDLSALGLPSSAWRDVVRTLCRLHLGRYEEAARTAAALPAGLRQDRGAQMVRVLVLGGNHAGNQAYFPAVAPKPAPARRPRVAVYTALFGPYDTLPPVLTRRAGVDFIAFTDQPGPVDGWDIRLRPRTVADPNLEAKHYKVFPWLHLPDHDGTLYVDANTLLLGDLDRLIDHWLLGEDFVGWAHPERTGIAEECMAVILADRGLGGRVLDQTIAYLAAGTPARTGLIEASFLWRRHDAEPVRALMHAWWAEITNRSTRDQISLSYLFHATGIRPAILPGRFGDARRSIFAAKLPHRGPDATAPRARPARPGPRRVMFAYDEAFRTTGSTVMRCFQAADLLRERLPDTRFEVHAEADLAGADLAGAVVILSKSALRTTDPERIVALRARGARILGDFVDAPPRDDLLPELDLVVAASLGAYVALATRWPGVPPAHLTHTVDPRLPTLAVDPAAPLRIGYFGEPLNAELPEALRDALTVVRVDTSSSDPAWLAELPGYGCHYAVRRRREGDGHKPFLKGFTAAHMGAVVIVGADDAEAAAYLGPDYPFAAASAAPDDLLAVIDKVRTAQGGADWRDALDRMAAVRERSSADWFAREFRKVLDAL